MSDIALRPREHLPELAWALFASVQLAAMWASPQWETIPFHFLWVSVTVLYGFRVWRVGTTMGVLAVVGALTGVEIARDAHMLHTSLAELTEVPLMSAMFLAMVWHARRRQAALVEARRLAQSLHRVLEREREFVSDASHELRTPITVARGHAELMRGGNLDAQGEEDMEVIVDELERLSVISERLLTLAAAEDPEFLHPSPVELDALLAGAYRRWAATATRDWQLDLLGRAVVRADSSRLEAALDALIENAVAFTGTGDTIRLASRFHAGMAVLEVADTGVGIPGDQVERVFDRFARAEGSRDRRSGGTGLGLAIVKAVAEAHGGSVSVTSRPGQGTVFRVELPGVEEVVGPGALVPLASDSTTRAS